MLITGNATFALITPLEIFFNKYVLLDINVFNTNDPNMVSGGIVKELRKVIATWYYAFRNFAAVILLVILIYVGIRMALSTVAEERAKYQRMLFDWVVSLLLIFVMQYLAIFIIYLNNAAVEALRQYVEGQSLGEALLKVGLTGVLGVGVESIGCALAFCAVVIITVLFLIAYINRMFKVAFLIMISPLISLTYAIDKMGDGKAQAFEGWLKEFIGAVAIQPFHCILYVAFVSVAFNLLEAGSVLNFNAMFSDESNQLAATVLALLCLFFIFDGEKVVKKIFGLQDEGDKTSLAGSLVVAMAAVKSSQKIASGARKTLNTSRAFAKNASEAIKRDRDKINGWGLKGSDSEGQGLFDGKNKEGKDFADKLSDFLLMPENAINKLHGSTGKLMDTLGRHGNSRAGRLIKGVAHLYGKDGAIGRWTSGIKIAAVAGTMMSLASGNGIGGAAATYKAMSKSSDEFNKGSMRKNTSAVEKLNERQAAKEDQEFQEVTNQLEDARKNEAEASDEATTAYMADGIGEDGKSGEFDKEMESQRQAVAEAQANLDAINQQIQEERARMIAGGIGATEAYGNLLEARGNAERELTKQSNKLSAMQEQYDKSKEFKESGRGLSKRAQEIYNMMQKRDDIAANISARGAAGTRARARISRTSDTELEQKKQEIIQKILEIKKKKERAGNDDDHATTNEFTTEEVDSAAAIATAVLSRVQGDLSANMAYDGAAHEQFIRGQLGATDSDMFKDEFSSLGTLISQYDSMVAGNMMSDYKSNFVSTGGSGELFDDRVASHAEATDLKRNTVFQDTIASYSKPRRRRTEESSETTHA